MVQETQKQTVQTENRSVKTPAMLYEPNDESSERCLQTQNFLDVRQQNELEEIPEAPTRAFCNNKYWQTKSHSTQGKNGFELGGKSNLPP